VTPFSLIESYHRFGTCLCVWMCPSLATKQLDGFYAYSVFKGFSIVGKWFISINILALKLGALPRGHQTQNIDSLEQINRFWLNFSLVWRLSPCIKLIMFIPLKNNGIAYTRQWFLERIWEIATFLREFFNIVLISLIPTSFLISHYSCDSSFCTLRLH
jgi:hypothetical protein